MAIFKLLHGNRGSIAGNYTLNPSNGALSGSLSWFKPMPLESSKDTVYKDGFGPIIVSAEGGNYTGIDLSNAQVGFTLGGLPTDFQQAFTVSSTRAVTLTAPIANSTKLTSPIPASGSVKGSFTIGGSLAPFEGQFVRIGGVTRAYGYFLLPTAAGASSAKLSGRVVLGLP